MPSITFALATENKAGRTKVKMAIMNADKAVVARVMSTLLFDGPANKEIGAKQALVPRKPNATIQTLEMPPACTHGRKQLTK
ncbi:MAG: hypothetical protein DHS20C04_25560 [Hyphococcus sp.]|nr:MAG: hypothetical protein DHS20C04_25560 [Marinicaulis sp.]